MKLTSFLPVFIFCFICLFGPAHIAAQDNTLPRFEPGDCVVPVPQGIKAECGRLFVPEDRRRTGSKTLRLPVIIIKSTSEHPAPDPVFYTGGGPGGGTMMRVNGAARLAPYTRDRDFIIFGQRGTGFAEPNLSCPEVDAANLKSSEQNFTRKKFLAEQVKAAKVCRDRLAGAGHVLSAYDSAANAADIEDLRKTLGIEKWNLYGVSYSARVMLNYIREYSRHVRSVILDSVLPTTVNWNEVGVDNLINSINLLFARCQGDEKCAAKYPKLEKEFYALLKTANKKAVVLNVNKDGKVYPIKLYGNDIVEGIYDDLSDTDLIYRVPHIITEVSKGNFGSLMPYAEAKLNQGGYAWGMRYSVWCREEMPFENYRTIARQSTKYSAIKGFSIMGAMPGICRVWNVPPASGVENEPVKSDIPALLLSGEYDPNTPMQWNRLVASWFVNSHSYEVKSTSHGVLFGNPCAVRVAASFLRDPSKPDTSCLAKISPVGFK